VGGIEEWVDGAGLEGGFEAGAADHVPTGAKQVVEQLELDDALGFDFGAESGLEGFELLLLVREDEDVCGAEGVFGGVVGDAGLAFGGEGAGGQLSVAAIGVDLGYG
jgi:hypothetical protein